jgi:hypothetical protein
MKVHFQTNLDEAQSDVFALNSALSQKYHDIIPHKGDRITFPFERWDNGASRQFEYALDVVGVSYNYVSETITIELHIPATHHSQSIAEWTTWFRKHRLGKDY